MVTRIPIASNNMPNQHNYMLFGHICPCNTKVRMIHTHLSVSLQFSVPRSSVSRINLGKTRNSGRRYLTNQAKRSLESALGAAMLLLCQRNSCMYRKQPFCILQMLPTGNEEVSLEFAHKGSLIHGLLQFYSSKKSIRKPSLAYDKHRICKGENVHFFSVKLLKNRVLMKPGLGFTVINRTSSAAFQHLQVVIIYSVNFYRI